jgi:glycosyltransferase involved in cell wall biosynthesis
MRGMQTEGIRVLMEVDDSYVHVPDVGLHSGWQEELDRSGRSDNFSFAAHEKLAEFVDGIIVSTEPLAELYGEFNDNIYICPNSIDLDDWDGSQSQDDGVLRIGWPASHSHLVDAPLVRRAFAWAASQKDVEVWVFGIGDAYKFPGSVKRVPWTDDQDAYKANLARCDVFVCPLIETAWSRFKSDVKALEAVAAGAWPIVSTATAYKPWHDRTMTCTTAKDWEQALRWVVRHRDEIPKLKAEAREYVLAERTIDKTITNWRKAVA